MDDLYTARAAIRQPALAGCGVMEHRKLAGVNVLYTARAAIRQPAQAGCCMEEHRKLAAMDNLYTGWLRGGGAQEARGRGRPLHYTGCHP